MCLASETKAKHLSCPRRTTATTTTLSSGIALWPVPVWLVATTIVPYIIWSGALLNAGYTKWFHWNSFLFLLTQNEFHCKLLALQGLTVTFGWYAALVFDWYMCSGNQFGRILYWNMPEFLTNHMIQPQDDDPQLLYMATTGSIVAMIVSHVLDTLGHPLLTYYYWRRTWRNDYSNNNNNNPNTKTSATNVDQTRGHVLTWPVILVAYLMSRTWSIVHTWYNFGTPDLFYFGYDVYVILDKEAWLEGMWLPAYIMEGFIFLLIVLYKLPGTSISRTSIVNENDDAPYKAHVGRSKKTDNDPLPRLDKIPSLLHASTISDSGAD